MASNFTLVITSCDRHDLLRRTIDSFIECTDQQPQETVIVEDSSVPMPEWMASNIHYYASRLGKIKWLQNEQRMGQIYSIDRAYAEVTTDFICHLEDDWEFIETNFIMPSKAILNAHPEVIFVSLRGDTGWHPLVRDNRFPFRIAEPNWRGGWGGFSFNCGLRRLSDYKRIGSYGRHVSYGTSGLGHEMLLSKMHAAMGFVIADLGRVIVNHIGGTRSRAIEPLPPMPRILIAIPACHKFEYGRWESEQSPRYNQATAWEGRPYGTDIHISGDNDRIAAIRDTWVKDIAPFASHVDYKFFYGFPHGREPLADEVFLECGDDYASLPAKTVGICKWASEHDYAYVLKVDDDTAVYVDRIVQELMTTRFDYAGYTHSNVCSGGPGYWLSKRAMKLVATSGNSDHWAEDVWVGKVMSNNNIPAIMLPGHRPGFSAHWFFPNEFDATKLTNDTTTFHAVQPSMMRTWYAHERSVK